MVTSSKPKKVSKASNPSKSSVRSGKDGKNTMENITVNPVIAFAVYAYRQGRTGIIKTITSHFSLRDIGQICHLGEVCQRPCNIDLEESK